MNENNQVPQQVPHNIQPTQPKKKGNIVLVIVLAVVGVLVLLGICGALAVGKIFSEYKKAVKEVESTYEEAKDNIKKEIENNTSTKAEASDELFQVNVNGVVINFPCTKEAFKGTGWEWDEKYAKKDLAGNYTTSGGRIGKYPGGVVVTVINDTEETKHIEDCTIDDGTFYNPKDGSENVVFVGGIKYESTLEEVKTIMTSLGYNNPKENVVGDSVFITYYKNDDQNNYKEKVEFQFYKETMQSVSIQTAG